jgi:hypothetical protein
MAPSYSITYHHIAHNATEIAVAHVGISFVLRPALYMQAIHGGTAKNDPIDSPKIAVLLCGSMLLHAYVYPAPMCATRDLSQCGRRPLCRL